MPKLIRPLIFILACFICTHAFGQQRTHILLNKNWKFIKGEQSGFADVNHDTRGWQNVTIPHDWAVYGPFSPKADFMEVAITQDGQTQAKPQPGRSGGLPYTGTGIYRRIINEAAFTPGTRATLVIDGAMSNAHVYINGKEVAFWPYGYNSFFTDITGAMKPGQDNVLAIHLNNPPESSRWYPGAGLYRNVHLVITQPVHVRTWGTQITTPFITAHNATVNIKTTVNGLLTPADAANVTIATKIYDKQGHLAAQSDRQAGLTDTSTFESVMAINNPQLWDIGKPNMYTAQTQVYYKGKLADTYTSKFGIRSIEYRADSGFYLNGRKVMFKGVCLHHDLGMLGAAVNTAAIRRQISIMQNMGANAIRTSHNMPAPEFVTACDEMGILLMPESFDEWQIPKMKNGYHNYFNEWYKRDLQNLVRHYRNSPSIVMWSIGNEVYEQGSPQGAKVAYILQQVCHEEDPTRPVTQGLDNPSGALSNGMAAIMDIAGFNYRPWRYIEEYNKLPQKLILGAETASTLSSRGYYKFPVERRAMAKYADFQSSGYDVEHCAWSDLPEDNFIMHDDFGPAMGEFVWTGFDYLGEPTPYYEEWPAHSSLFGIVDLAGIPKDRYYLYRSLWNTKENTLHILPHWNWPERKGVTTPVFVYTNYPSAELFINGKSQGIKRKDTSIHLNRTDPQAATKTLERLPRYRLMWMDTKYEPGELKVIAYDASGRPAATQTVHTSGKPYAVKLTADRQRVKADGEDMAFINVRLVDKNGNFCPTDERAVTFKVSGAGTFEAQANGSNISLENFQAKTMHLFAGQLTGAIRPGTKPGTITVTVTATGGVKADTITIQAH